MIVDDKSRWYRNPKNRKEWLHGNQEEIVEDNPLIRMRRDIDELKRKVKVLEEWNER
jgi:hypothetical protein